CPLWKQKRARFSVNDIVFPLHIFCDGVECNNPLGSHNRVLDAVYASLPCLPSECQSLIENVFLVYLYEYSLRKDFTDKEIFAHLISMLKSLEDDGILVQTNDGEKRIYFVTCLLLADNKAMNSLGGFVEGFTANYFCRFCKAFIDDTRTQAIEMPNLLRDEISYAEDVAACAPILTGVKSDCFLNALPSFHITSNYSVDIFHDLAEGCCHYVVVHVLKHCIPKFFTLETLNDRISSFYFGLCESNNIPLINDNRLNEGCTKLRMSGSETMMFVKYLGLLVGDLIPENDDYWLLFLKLRQVIDICFSKCITASTSTSLRILVEEFN
ncbi:uncharacterized protein LOC127752042, partial [Frankliniella occidentalis]|uniref:Uncharacterized protein LOC127752042 n=1 Tax=Frankliniella occidentalis TaxID=133901 RepID=A0A9C6XBB2_FRAOC